MRARLRIDHGKPWWVWGAGDTIEWCETRRTPGSAAGCNKPASVRWWKTARWCETTRSEQDCEVGTSRPKRQQQCGRRSEHRSRCRWRGTGPALVASLRQQCRRRRPGPGRIPGEEVGSTDPGDGTRTLDRSEAHEGRSRRT